MKGETIPCSFYQAVSKHLVFRPFKLKILERINVRKCCSYLSVSPFEPLKYILLGTLPKNVSLGQDAAMIILRLFSFSPFEFTWFLNAPQFPLCYSKSIVYFDFFHTIEFYTKENCNLIGNGSLRVKFWVLKR